MIADDLRAHLPELRIEVESLMIDSCVITRAGAPVFDDNTGLETPASTTVYEGKCQLRDPGVAEVNREFGEQQVTAATQVLVLPLEVDGVPVTGIMKGDVAVVTSEDPQAGDLVFRIEGIPASTWAVSNNFNVEAIF
jgi:hypothetical protein